MRTNEPQLGEDESSIWSTFQQQVQNLFEFGYNLPEVLQISAIEDVEGRLVTWKEKVTSPGLLTTGPNEEPKADVLSEQQNLSEHPPSIKAEKDHSAILNDILESVGEPQTFEGTTYIVQELSIPDIDNSAPRSNRRRNHKLGLAREQNHSTTPALRKSKRKRKRLTPGLHIKKEIETETDNQNDNDGDGDNEDLLIDEEGHSDVKEDQENEDCDGQKCHLCFKTYNSKSGFAYHMKKHDLHSHPCKECSFIGAKKSDLYAHMLSAHNVSESVISDMKSLEKLPMKKESFACDVCDKKFKTKQNLRLHHQFHDRGTLKCPHCPKEFKSECGFKSHMNFHTGQGLHPCELCSYIASSLSAYNTHKARVHERIEKHLCDICGRGFVTSSRLTRHRKTVHMRGELKDHYECPHCDHKTHCEVSLKAHIRNIHEEKAGFVCNICGLTLKYKHSLIDHQKRHTSSKDYQCAECDFRGTCVKDVKNHIRRMHQAAKERCDVCGKVFRQRGHLIRHRVIHTGEKNFACRLCSYVCNVQGNLRKHMLHVHKMDERRRPAIQKVDAIATYDPVPTTEQTDLDLQQQKGEEEETKTANHLIMLDSSGIPLEVNGMPVDHSMVTVEVDAEVPGQQNVVIPVDENGLPLQQQPQQSQEQHPVVDQGEEQVYTVTAIPHPDQDTSSQPQVMEQFWPS